MPVTNEVIISAEDLRKVYVIGKIEYPALCGVSFSINKGDFVAIVGPSGSGKSTLLNMLGALDRPSGGKIHIDGVDISTLNDDKLAELRNTRLGFIFQTFNLLTYMSALDNVEVPLIASGTPKAVRLKKGQELLEAVGLKGFEKNRPTELSGGQQQRVAIARALTNSPQILLADEPTGNLDSKSANEIIAILRKLNRDDGVTVIMVTHNMQLTEFCNRVWYVKDGIIEKEVLQDV